MAAGAAARPGRLVHVDLGGEVVRGRVIRLVGSRKGIATLIVRTALGDFEACWGGEVFHDGTRRPVLRAVGRPGGP